MTDKIQKYFSRLSVNERKKIFQKLEEIEQRGIKAGDVRPLKNSKGYYRVRIGRLIRIVFRFEDGKVVIVDADNRDNIYR